MRNEVATVGTQMTKTATDMETDDWKWGKGDVYDYLNEVKELRIIAVLRDALDAQQ